MEVPDRDKVDKYQIPPIPGVVVIPDESGRERMVAYYQRRRGLGVRLLLVAAGARQPGEAEVSLGVARIALQHRLVVGERLLRLAPRLAELGAEPDRRPAAGVALERAGDGPLGLIPGAPAEVDAGHAQPRQPTAPRRALREHDSPVAASSALGFGGVTWDFRFPASGSIETIRIEFP